MRLKLLGFLFLITSCTTQKEPSLDTALPLPPYTELTQYSSATEQEVIVNASSIEEIVSSMKRLYSTKTIYRPILEDLSSKLFQNLLQSNDPEVVMMTVLAAPTCHHPLSLRMAALLTHSPYPIIQLSAIQALSSLDTLEANAMLVEALRSDYPVIRLEAGWFIAQKKISNAFSHIDALCNKLPKELLPYMPELYALEGSPSSIQRLRQLLFDPNEETVIETLLAVGKFKIFAFSELLPTFQTHSPAVLEALAYSLQFVNTCTARERLKILAQHPSSQVSLQACLSLITLGDPSFQKQIEKKAINKDLFALSALGSCPAPPLLDSFTWEESHKINLCFVELMHRKKNAIAALKEILALGNNQVIRTIPSLGGSLFYWAIEPLETKPQDLQPSLIESSLRAKEKFLSLSIELDESSFLEIASYIFQEGLYDLYPCLMHLLENKQTEGALSLLREEAQRLGAPFNRAFATLGIIKIEKTGREKDLLPLLSLSREKESPSWRFPLPWTEQSAFVEKTPHQQTTMLAQLYIETVSSLADRGSEEAIQILVDELSLAPRKYLPFVVAALLHATL